MSANLLKSVAKGFDENNLRTAREVLADPDAWGGEGSGMVDWARRVAERLERVESATPKPS